MGLHRTLTHLVGGLRTHEGVADDLGAALVLATVKAALKPLELEDTETEWGQGYRQAVRDAMAILDE